MRTAWLVAAGAVAGAAVLAIRSRRAATPSGGGGLCDRAAQLDPRAGAACQVLGGVLGALGEVLPDSPSERAAANARLNGEARAVHPALRAVSQVYASRGGQAGSTTVTDLYPLVEPAERYANGCVPVPGHPDWAKCAPGTVSQVWAPVEEPHGHAARNAFRGSADDPYHRRHPATVRRLNGRGPGARPVDEPAPAFPLAVPAGHSAWWDRGEPRVCPPSTVLQGTSGAPVDHRPGAPRCVPAPGGGGFLGGLGGLSDLLEGRDNRDDGPRYVPPPA